MRSTERSPGGRVVQIDGELVWKHELHQTERVRGTSPSLSHSNFGQVYPGPIDPVWVKHP